MPSPFEQFKTRLGISQGGLKNLGFNYSPTVIQQGQSTSDQIGQGFSDKLGQRKVSGQDIYNNNKQQNTTRLANKLIDQSAGLKFDEFGKPNLNLADFGQMGNATLKSISERGDLATQASEARRAFQNAVDMQNIGQYNLSGNLSVSGTDIPGASANNPGAKVAAGAAKVMANHTPYVWGGNSLSKGIDCSGLVQQLYRQYGINLPRTTYEQAKSGHVVSTGSIRPGDLVFYGNDYHHVGIYAGNGHIIHAANSKLGVIQSNLNNSNGRPTLIIRPY
ncbi:C40 family peptidase [Streptomyces sp. NPDC048720]|uniref:C40 family peptidase n=1 Tax=Streptomyces sp. NPDC048720 TaxID=3365588 RepID=UPI00371693DC